MRALIQRVARAKVSVADTIVGEIGRGVLIFLGVADGDQSSDKEFLLKKIPALRIFPDEQGKMNLSLLDMGGEALVVSQFTLLADTQKGNRPSYFSAATPDLAKATYLEFCSELKNQGLKVKEGVFGADMQVELVNDGPVTIWLDSKARG